MNTSRLGRLAFLLIVSLVVVVPGLCAGTIRVVSEQVEVRREAGVGGSVLGTASKGTVYQVLGQEGGWIQVAYPIGNGAFYTGFIPASACDSAPGARPSPTGPASLAASPASPVTQQAPPADNAPPPNTAAAPIPIVATPAVVAALLVPGAPAPGHIFGGARLFIDDTGEFGIALAAAFIEKKVPVVVVTDQAKADFVVHTASQDRRSGGGERLARVLVGAWGNGDRYHATASITNRDGIVVFAYNVKKGNFQNAANSTANEIKNKGITH